jgi:hypothetical protein
MVPVVGLMHGMAAYATLKTNNIQVKTAIVAGHEFTGSCPTGALTLPYTPGVKCQCIRVTTLRLARERIYLIDSEGMEDGDITDTTRCLSIDAVSVCAAFDSMH